MKAADCLEMEGFFFWGGGGVPGGTKKNVGFTKVLEETKARSGPKVGEGLSYCCLLKIPPHKEL